MGAIGLPAGVSPINPDDPSTIGFPPRLPFELVMRTGTPKEVCEAYSITRQQYEQLCVNPLFVAACKKAHEALVKDGALSFRMKAGLIAEEEGLKVIYSILSDKMAKAEVRLQAANMVAKFAGWEDPARREQASTGTTFNIVLDLSAPGAPAAVQPRVIENE